IHFPVAICQYVSGSFKKNRFIQKIASENITRPKSNATVSVGKTKSPFFFSGLRPLDRSTARVVPNLQGLSPETDNPAMQTLKSLPPELQNPAIQAIRDPSAPIRPRLSKICRLVLISKNPASESNGGKGMFTSTT